MNARGLFRAAGILALIFAVVGAVAVAVGAALAGELDAAPVAMVVTALALAMAGAMVAVVAMLAEWVLQNRIADPEARVIVASMIAAAMVLLSGFMSIGSLGLLAFAVTAVLAVATQQVLHRTLG